MARAKTRNDSAESALSKPQEQKSFITASEFARQQANFIPQLMKVARFAKIIDCSVSKAYELVASGRRNGLWLKQRAA